LGVKSFCALLLYQRAGDLSRGFSALTKAFYIGQNACVVVNYSLQKYFRKNPKKMKKFEILLKILKIY